jgi:hypothetical protein
MLAALGLRRTAGAGLRLASGRPDGSADTSLRHNGDVGRQGRKKRSASVPFGGEHRGRPKTGQQRVHGRAGRFLRDLTTDRCWLSDGLVRGLAIGCRCLIHFISLRGRQVRSWARRVPIADSVHKYQRTREYVNLGSQEQVISMRHVLLRALVVPAATLALAGAAAAPALAQTATTAQLGRTASLVATGAAVQLSVAYRCATTASAPALSATVTERVAGGIAQGSGTGASNTLACDGRQHTTHLSVATTNNVAFRKGAAFVQGDLFAGGPPGSFTDFSFSGTVTIQ